MESILVGILIVAAAGLTVTANHLWVANGRAKIERAYGKTEVVEGRARLRYRSSALDTDEVNPLMAWGWAEVISTKGNLAYFTYVRLGAMRIYVDFAQLYLPGTESAEAIADKFYPIDQSRVEADELILEWDYKRPIMQSHRSKLRMRFDPPGLSYKVIEQLKRGSR